MADSYRAIVGGKLKLKTKSTAASATAASTSGGASKPDSGARSSEGTARLDGRLGIRGLKEDEERGKAAGGGGGGGGRASTSTVSKAEAEKGETEATASGTAAREKKRPREDAHGASKRERKGSAEEDEEREDEVLDPKLEALLAGLTPAQRRHELHRRKIEATTMKGMAAKSHREKVDEFNTLLANLPIHNDIPKVAAAGLG